MELIRQNDGSIEYVLHNRRAVPLRIAASNRQKKILRFFGVRFTANITKGAAGWEIADLMLKEECRERWRRYLFLTKDFGSDTDSLKPFDETALQAVQIPDHWSLSEELRPVQDELVDEILRDESPFDRPQPDISFVQRTFVFTGKFMFGTRKACQDAVLSRGGFAPNQKSVSRLVDYLVIGTEGSNAWRRGAYGNKIEDAIIARRDYGSPAIVSEQHWVAALKAPV